MVSHLYEHVHDWSKRICNEKHTNNFQKNTCMVSYPSESACANEAAMDLERQNHNEGRYSEMGAYQYDTHDDIPYHDRL